jgi:integrase
MLRSLLEAHWERSHVVAPEALVFPTRTGRQRSKDNIRGRILAPAIARANELLEARRSIPLPAGLSPHKLRHTFASILVACGEDPAAVMYQLGHTNPEFTLRVYSHSMRRDPGERTRLKALVSGGHRHILRGTSSRL